MEVTLTIAGFVSVIAAIIGGGLKLAGSEFPVIQSLKARMTLALAGLLAIGFAQFKPPEAKGDASTSAAAPAVPISASLIQSPRLPAVATPTAPPTPLDDPTAPPPVSPSPPCPIAVTSRAPKHNVMGWPVYKSAERIGEPCHVSGGSAVNVLCRSGAYSICIEGADPVEGGRCQGFVHSDAFVSGGVPAKATKYLAGCSSSCPPPVACALKQL